MACESTPWGHAASCREGAEGRTMETKVRLLLAPVLHNHPCEFPEVSSWPALPSACQSLAGQLLPSLCAAAAVYRGHRAEGRAPSAPAPSPEGTTRQ